MIAFCDRPLYSPNVPIYYETAADRLNAVQFNHFQKIPLYNAINTLQGYQQIAIFSPREVIQYEDEEI
jgi:hypothetical protein